MNNRQWRVLVIALAVVVLGSAGIAHAQCGPMDVVFVVDTTGSMGGALENVASELPSIISQIQNSSGGDYRLGLVEFKDEVIVLNDIASGNTDSVEENIQGLEAGGGSNEPESSDEALKTVIRGLRAADREEGQQTGDFVGGFRAEAAKIIILITDARPAGFDDDYETGVDDVAAANLAGEAAAAGIRISAVFVPTLAAESFDVVETVTAIMTNYATISSGLFHLTNSDGTGTADAINEIIAACGFGGASANSLQIAPSVVFLSSGESADVSVVNYAPGNLDTIVYTAVGLPPDSTVTFTPRTAEVEGTNEQVAHVTIGPNTPPGTYIVYVEVTHTDDPFVLRNYFIVVVDCRAPALLGTGQPVTQVVPRGSSATFTVAPIGSPAFKYQWYSGFTGMTGSPVAGATSATFTTPAVNEFGSYWVRITNVCGSFDSNAAFVIPQ